jgi:hypothetical protein
MTKKLKSLIQLAYQEGRQSSRIIISLSKCDLINDQGELDNRQNQLAAMLAAAYPDNQFDFCQMSAKSDSLSELVDTTIISYRNSLLAERGKPESPAQNTIENLKKEIIAELDRYISNRFLVLFSGNHHNTRAKAIRMAITYATQLNELKNILTNQEFVVGLTDKAVTPPLTLENRWSLKENHKNTFAKNSAYKVVIQNALTYVKLYEDKVAVIENTNDLLC